MGISRRDFLAVSGVAATGSIAVLTSCAANQGLEFKADKPAEKAGLVVGTCGICCSKCPLMAAGKCKGCGPATTEGAVSSKCPVRSCAAKKGIAYCGTDCKGFLGCNKVVGKPYAKQYLQKLAEKIG